MQQYMAAVFLLPAQCTLGCCLQRLILSRQIGGFRQVERTPACDWSTNGRTGITIVRQQLQKSLRADPWKGIQQKPGTQLGDSGNIHAVSLLADDFFHKAVSRKR